MAEGRHKNPLVDRRKPEQQQQHQPLQSSSMDQNQDLGSQQEVVSHWMQLINEWYPRLLQKTYFLPPLHFNRISCETASFSGQRVRLEEEAMGRAVVTSSVTNNDGVIKKSTGKKMKSPIDSDVRDDRARDLVLGLLRDVADAQQEVMMVISQLGFGHYLNKPCYSTAAHYFPRAVDLDQKYRQGDFDVLIIHAKHGLMLGQIKSVGAIFDSLEMTVKEEEEKVLKKVKLAVSQLIKAKTVLEHLVKDLSMDFHVTRMMLLPYIDSRLLAKVVKSSPEFEKEFCECMGTTDLPKAVELCLCRDQLGQPHAWWKKLIEKSQDSNNVMTEKRYKELIVRFCGPATTVRVFCINTPNLELRTEGQAIAETGRRMAELQMFPNQLEILNKTEPRLFLTGPPGTGKSLLLMLKGLQWLQKGHNVHVVSTWYKSPASSFMIEYQLQETLKKSPRIKHEVIRYQYNFQNEDELTTAVKDLTPKAVGGQLHVIVDEPGPDLREDALQLFVQHAKDYKQSLKKADALKILKEYYFSHLGHEAEKKFKKFDAVTNDEVHVGEFQQLYSSLGKENKFNIFCKELLKGVPKLCLWAAAIESDIKPDCLKEEVLTIPLRSPPSVVREVSRCVQIKQGYVHNYTQSPIPPVTDGPKVKRLTHRGVKSHKSGPLQECEECGREIARVLIELQVGIKVPAIGNSSSPPSLEYRDVLVLCENPVDEEVIGEKVTPACGLVRGLRECKKFPVRAVKRFTDDSTIRDTALALSNEVTVSHYRHVLGLEKKVVVLAPNLTWRNDYDRLYDMSRCTSQLILIDQLDDSEDDVCANMDVDGLAERVVAI